MALCLAVGDKVSALTHPFDNTAAVSLCHCTGVASHRTHPFDPCDHCDINHHGHGSPVDSCMAASQVPMVLSATVCGRTGWLGCR